MTLEQLNFTTEVFFNMIKIVNIGKFSNEQVYLLTFSEDFILKNLFLLKF